MRYFLEIAYKGSNFHGWQTQPNAVSVQSTIEKALSTILREQISVTGAGRTDTGVNARQMFAHFDSKECLLSHKSFLTSLNSMVGRDIVVKDIVEVDKEAHARFDASERSYKYFVTFVKTPFFNDYSWRSSSSLDIEKMNLAAEILTSTKDFTSFAKLHSDAKTNICDVRHASWEFTKDDKEASSFLGNIDDGIVFTITADRFLRNMVRAVVGTLVDVGRNKISLDQFQNIIRGKDRCLAGTSMPAHALFLWSIKYPYL